MTNEILNAHPSDLVRQYTGADSQPFTDFDRHLFQEGKHRRLYEKLGAHPGSRQGQAGVSFGVWAPNAKAVSVALNRGPAGAFACPLTADSIGIWTGFVAGAAIGDRYQYQVQSSSHPHVLTRPDPFAFRQTGSPEDLSFVCDLAFEWHDDSWIAERAGRASIHAPITIYQVHLASWRRVPEEGNRWLTFSEIGPKLARHAAMLGFTHVELLPIMQQPIHGAEFLRISGRFAPASHYGSPAELMALVDCLHQHGLGVLLAWPPAVFPAEEPGLALFDGTHLYEQGPWPTPVAGAEVYDFDIGKPEVRSFLLSNAVFWLDKFHFDGVRAMALNKLLPRKPGPGAGTADPSQPVVREDLQGVEFIRSLCSAVSESYSGAILVGDEESTPWLTAHHSIPATSLGFSYKWDPAFAEPALLYFGQDPLFRKHYHKTLTSFSEHAFSERFILPLSERVQVHGRSSLLGRLAGDEWQRLANYRLLLAFQYLRPGKKLLFMGTELASWSEWNASKSLDWHLLEQPAHEAIQRWVGDLNHLYRSEPALHASDNWAGGFEWVDYEDAERSTLSWLRRDPQRREVLLCILNCTPVVRRNFQVGVRRPGTWREILNSDATIYGGSGQGNLGLAQTAPFPFHRLPCLLTITLPPLAAVIFKHEP